MLGIDLRRHRPETPAPNQRRLLPGRRQVLVGSRYDWSRDIEPSSHRTSGRHGVRIEHGHVGTPSDPTNADEALVPGRRYYITVAPIAAILPVRRVAGFAVLSNPGFFFIPPSQSLTHVRQYLSCPFLSQYLGPLKTTEILLGPPP